MAKVVDIKTKRELQELTALVEGCPANTAVGILCFVLFMIFVVSRAMG